ncbi:hypothetical protein AUEXF2481DRAFT_70936 [Aureobasidium subglaciale EXF-2481]|uniref:Mitochondrial carrier protein n=1 Tax=Aureobasidium subglaciale (strain EXF-2481) TaxID=1043005 RepID=A0A074Y9C2_AURSE|nr:uncharacterized protein AUEXF2481DRAFT_70936 [Aureobasidium subglaciale EXF-2481]KEQ90777.1 hypothetical protein AUEXF2481DRAFT_70936 [Aureobasidium subglaciale EXF-2481]
MAGNNSTDILIAGAFAAFTVDLFVYPLDTLKTRFQSPDYNRLYLDKATNAVNKQVLFRGLYQGVGSVIIATLPSSGAFFTTYEGVKSTFTKYNPTLSGSSSALLPQPLIHSAASSIAELVSCAILTPAEVIKQNAQMVDTARGDKVNATLQTIAKFRSNPLALWRGYTALAGRNLPFTALQFPIFERLKEGIKKHREDRGTRTNTLLENGLITAASAGTAGAFAAVVTTPVDVVKTRIMLAAASSAAEDQANDSKTKPKGPVDATGRPVKSSGKGLKGPVSRKGSIQIAKEIIADKGVIKGLFRGGALRAVWTLIGSGLYLGVYETGRVYLAQRRGEDIDDEDI